ncbi:MAG: hypothetical protein DI534_04945 [Leifsonia xyli]|nr:MAG: hypothetical protein DI534_04945 [Leifsonia xyli]
MDAFTEPTARLPLRFGDHATRLWAGTWLIVGGGTAIAGSNTVTLWLLGVATGAHVAGWCILPSAGWRRVVAVGPATLTMWLLLAGPRFVIVLVVPYLLWLLVRHRPPLAALTALPVALTALLVGEAFGLDYARMPAALAVVGVTMFACAWAARLIARIRPRRRERTVTDPSDTP